MYNKTVMDHFRNPRNVGVLEDANGVGEVGNPLCGDMMTIYLKIIDDRIEDIKFQTFGCGSAIAVSSMLTEIAMGKTIEEIAEMAVFREFFVNDIRAEDYAELNSKSVIDDTLPLYQQDAPNDPKFWLEYNRTLLEQPLME